MTSDPGSSSWTFTAQSRTTSSASSTLPVTNPSLMLVTDQFIFPFLSLDITIGAEGEVEYQISLAEYQNETE